jgi:hypothetical protein
MTGIYHSTQLSSVEMESHNLFCLGWPGTSILPISASQVARIVGLSHQHPAHFVLAINLIVHMQDIVLFHNQLLS